MIIASASRWRYLHQLEEVKGDGRGDGNRDDLTC